MSNELCKSLMLSDADETAVPDVLPEIRVLNGKLDKISFEDRKLQGSDLEWRSPADADKPEKAAKFAAGGALLPSAACMEAHNTARLGSRFLLGKADLPGHGRSTANAL